MGTNITPDRIVVDKIEINILSVKELSFCQ
jgi:hypothetical protein